MCSSDLIRQASLKTLDAMLLSVDDENLATPGDSESLHPLELGVSTAPSANRMEEFVIRRKDLNSCNTTAQQKKTGMRHDVPVRKCYVSVSLSIFLA